MNGLKLLGWMLIRREPRDDGQEENFPPFILTASNCFCEVHPEYDDWCESDRLAFLRVHERNAQGSFIMLDHPNAARYMNLKWFKGELEVFGLAVSPAVFEHFDKILVRQTIASNAHLAHITHYLEALPWPENGERIIGYDVLGWDYGFHTYLCSYLGNLLSERWKTNFNQQGLIPDAKTARELAKAVNSEELGEPCFYF